VLVAEGASVHRGQRLAVIEAMKMEPALVAPIGGVVAEVAIRAGDQVNERARMMMIEPGNT
jgi:3-methylcrotonyl-CoA carboxylase alpha subunit